MITTSKRYFYNIIIVFGLSVFIGCSSNKKLLLVSQSLNHAKIIVKKPKKYDRVTWIQIPSNLNFLNNTKENIQIVKITYLYANSSRSNRRMINLYKSNYSQKTRFSGVKNVGNKKELVLNYHTMHYISQPSDFKDADYLLEMQSKNQDTLHIGTIAQFKKKHPGFLERLTKNDSISVTLLNNEDMPGKVIKVPVRY